MFAIVSANLRRSKARTAATALGIAVGVGMIVALLSFTQGLKETAAGFVHLGGSDLGIFQANVSDPTASLLPETMVARVASSPDVAAATPLVLIVEGIKSDQSAVVFGADPSGFFTRNLVVTAGHSPAPSTQQILVGERLASQQHLSVGSPITISGHSFTVGGIYRSGILFQDSGAVLSLEQAQALTGRAGEVTDIVVQLSPGSQATAAGRRIERNSPAPR